MIKLSKERTMCGIAGIFNRKTLRPVEEKEIRAMTGPLEHRGPDSSGTLRDREAALGHTRLSIIDPAGGHQPVYNEDRSIGVVLNGEIYNYIELRSWLIKKGHSFYTDSDTEVLVHLYEEEGADFIRRLNGQFAFIIWDRKERAMTVARDRVGIRPVYYSELPSGDILLASEIKSILASGKIPGEFDPLGIEEVFTIWANIPPATPFKGVKELPPAHIMQISHDKVSISCYWSLDFPSMGESDSKPLSFYIEGMKELIDDSIRLRLRADVPVGAYLSGGIDSSIISTIVKTSYNKNLRTFSLAFKEDGFDESSFQQIMIDHLNTDHSSITVTNEAVGKAIEKTVFYAEKPLLRSAPAPLFLLSRLVRDENIKVVLTGEGADEIFGGYNIFRENKIRRFWARDPESRMRPLLLAKLYRYINKDPKIFQFWKGFFKKGLTDTDNPFYSHMIRWSNTSKIKKFLSPDLTDSFDEDRLYRRLLRRLPENFMEWHPLSRAQYLEITTFMSGYLLSTQGDRMMMGNSIEGRFPFLDHRLIEFSSRIPPEFKIKFLQEKFILKQAYKDILPDKIVNRNKKPYRAPISSIFPAEKAEALLEKDTGCLNKKIFSNLLKKSKTPRPLSAVEEMGLIGGISLQMLQDQFIS